MKAKFILLMVFITSINLSSCKKGDDDPAISFRSRKERLVGEWQLKSGNITYSDTSGTIAITYTQNSISSIYVHYLYSEKWDIKESGLFEMNSNIQGNKTTLNGYWCFGKRVNGLDLKNKEYVIFHVISEKYVDYTGNTMQYNYTGNNRPIYYFIIKELRNKKMVVDADGTYTSTAGDYTKAFGTYTYMK